ncbi:ATP-binding protein [Pyrobaculum aerophilum]|uniref:ATPase AAA-type core domain-containing protein n=1 Tax=Pyrobaculum aerophilum TaxID=13773 RepID=A0A371R524_9CREN|nr:ATP-binding protein [Pyrobaculum aerophilum]RFA93081.1 hypothetical protein CGL51_13455 [Pyrobaculum aerophilum]RFA99175.1 hypothetical protein CGL52_04880 [Pyrobaculum aerophilum]
MDFKIEIRPSKNIWLKGEGELGDKTVVMGAPRSGKTTFLKLLYSLLTPFENEFIEIAKDTARHILEEDGQIKLRVGRYELSCSYSAEDGELGCVRDGESWPRHVYLLYEGFELTLKSGLAPPLFQNMVARMDKFTEGQRTLPEFRYTIFRRDGRWYEKFEKMRDIPLSNASNAVALVGYLERLSQLKDGWILIDGLLDGLYPEDALYIAARLLESKATVVVTTHSPWVKDLFLCGGATMEIAGIKVPQPEVAAYEIRKGEENEGVFEKIRFSSYGDIYDKLYVKC